MLTLKDRPHGQKLAASSAATTTGTNMRKILQYEIETGIAKLLSEREPPIELSHKQLHFSGSFINYTHQVAIAIWHKDPDKYDIKTEGDALMKWLDDNNEVQGVINGHNTARALRDKFVAEVNSGETANMTEEQLQARVKEIRDCVPEPTEEMLEYLGKYCGRR